MNRGHFSAWLAATLLVGGWGWCISFAGPVQADDVEAALFDGPEDDGWAVASDEQVIDAGYDASSDAHHHGYEGEYVNYNDGYGHGGYTGEYGGSCGSGGCGTAGCATCKLPTVWARADYLFWWVKGGHVPALVTQGGDGTLANSTVIFGNEDIGTDHRSGGRIRSGVWLGSRRKHMVVGEFFALGDRKEGFAAGSFNDTILGRPFTDVNGGTTPSAVLIGSAFREGVITVESTTDVLGAGAYVMSNIYRNHGPKLDFIWGYRFLRVDDGLVIRDNATADAFDGFVAQGTTFDGADVFDVENEFHGGEVGLQWQYRRNRWSMTLLGKCAFGNTRQQINISGNNLITTPGPTVVNRIGDVLAQETNIGTYTNDEFAVLPEAGADLTYHFNKHLRFTVGYSFLYLSDVARAGDQIDLQVHSDLLNDVTPVNPERPQFVLQNTDLWLQGINFGIDLTY